MIRLTRSLITTMLIAVSAIGIATETTATSLSKAFPGSTVLSSSAGEIEGAKRIAAIISDKNSSEMTILVLAETNSGRLTVLAKSDTGPMHPRWYGMSVKIKNESVYFELSGNGGCCSDYSQRYQFKTKDGQFVLVGTESSSTGFEPQVNAKGVADVGQPPVLYSFGTSANYLSGSALHWRVQTLSPSDNPFKDDISKVKTGKKRVEKTLRFLPKKVTLEGFSLWKEADAQPEHLGGYFDQKFEYHE